MSNSQQVSYGEQALSPTDIAGSRSPIREIWGGMRGKILVLHSGWNPKKAIQDIDLYSKETLDGVSLHDMKIDKEKAEAVITKLAKYDNLLIEGDMVAADHVLSLLRFLYDPKDIIVKNSWELGLNLEKVREHKYFKHNGIKKYNVVLLCGPRGNLATALLLEEAKLSWLFDLQNNRAIRTRPTPGEGKLLSPKKFQSSDILRRDYGVFLRSNNPYNPEKRIYMLMGVHANGTQGAAALACNIKSATDVVEASSDISIQSYGVDYMAWVEVWRERRPKVGEFSDPNLKYKICWPPRPEGEWEDYTNPSYIYDTQTQLRTALLENTLFLGARPNKLLLYSFALSIVILLSCALFWTTYKLPITVAALILAVVGAAKMFLSLLMPPAKRK